MLSQSRLLDMSIPCRDCDSQLKIEYLISLLLVSGEYSLLLETPGCQLFYAREKQTYSYPRPGALKGSSACEAELRIIWWHDGHHAGRSHITWCKTILERKKCSWLPALHTISAARKACETMLNTGIMATPSCQTREKKRGEVAIQKPECYLHSCCFYFTLLLWLDYETHLRLIILMPVEASSDILLRHIITVPSTEN